MKSFENIDVKSVKEAVNLLQKFQQQKKLRRWSAAAANICS